MTFEIFSDSGWMQNIQEKASEWDDWDELVERGALLTIELGIIIISLLTYDLRFCFLSIFLCLYSGRQPPG